MVDRLKYEGDSLFRLRHAMDQQRAEGVRSTLEQIANIRRELGLGAHATDIEIETALELSSQSTARWARRALTELD